MFENAHWVNKFGFNTDCDSGDDVWDGSNAYTWPSAAAATTVASTSANDTDGGTGAHEVTIEGLDANWQRVTQTVKLNGASNVALGTNLLRCYRAYIGACGSGGVNAGNIQVKHGATVLAQISTGYGQTLMAIYTIPDGQYGHLAGWRAQQSPNAASELALQTRTDGAGWRTRDLIVLDSSGNSGERIVYPRPQRLPAKTDMRVRAILGNNNLNVAAQFDLFLCEAPI